jgi:hypothetical protein
MKVVIERTTQLKAVLKQQSKKYGDGKSIVIGFAQTYALFVHEINAAYRVGQWKYLETAIKQMRQSMGQWIATELKKGKKLDAVQLAACRKLLAYAKTLTPKDTGALRASGYVCFEEQHQAVSEAAYKASEQIRLAAKGK